MIESPITTRLAALSDELAAIEPATVPQAIADAAAALLDASTLVLATLGGHIEPLAAASESPAAAAQLESIRRQTIPGGGILTRILATGEAVLQANLSAESLDAEAPALSEYLQALGVISVALVPLGIESGAVGPVPRAAGVLAVFRLTGQAVLDEVDLAIAEGLAGAAGARFAEAVSARHHLVRRGQAGDVYVTDLLDALPLEAAVISAGGLLRATNRRWDEYSTAAEFDGTASGVGTDYLDRLAGAATRHRGAAHLLAGITDVLRGNLATFSTDYESAGGKISRTYSLTVMPLGESADGAIITRTDVTLRKSLERQLAQRATHDALTGLPNRMLLQERLTHAVARSARSGSLVAVLFCDLDQFKFVNDTLGHDVGDKVLIAVADRLRLACRATDSITRFGGDEFVVVAEDLNDVSGANSVAATLLDSLRNPFTIDDQELYFGVSIGVAVAQGSPSLGSNSAAILLREADTAMYEAKRAGRNRVVVFRAELQQAAERALRLSTSLRAAMSQDQLTLEFQPQFDARTGVLLGAEALLRWEHPELGHIPADEFLAEAEESGTIIELGLWTIEAACAQAAAWVGHVSTGFSIGVNLTARQLTHPDLVDQVGEAIQSHGIAPHLLTLEIPEGALADDPHRMAGTLARLHALGVRLAIDNFGTGYSSLSYLQAFPVDELKVDRTFVVVLGENPRAAAMVSGISGLAKALGFRLVAEGVESEAQLAAVQSAGCDSYQGLGEPESATEFGVRLGLAQPVR